MRPILKYPRTPHLAGSRLQPGDGDVRVIGAESFDGLSLVFEEKLDGSNSGVSFDEDGDLMLQSRGHVLTGGPRERQFNLFKRWASHHTNALHEILGCRYVMYGEWLYARHSIAYDQLPHYFLEFDLLDRETGDFLSTEARCTLLAGGPVVSVPVLGTGTVAAIERYLGRSRYSSTESMEGLYLKHEENGRVLARCKYVRTDFLQAVAESDTHWRDRPIEPNQLRAGVDLFG